MRRPIFTFLSLGLICLLAGCQRAAPENALPQPDFPLKEEAVMAAQEQTGLPGVISPSETYSSREGHISYTLRDPAKTYGDTENQVVTAAVSSAITHGERFLGLSFFSDTYEPGTRPFAWENWKQQFAFATLLYGGFADEEAVYRAFAAQAPPEDAESMVWEAALPGGYCRVRYSLIDTDTIHGFPIATVLKQRDVLRVNIYASRSLYEKMDAEAQARKAELERQRAAGESPK